MESDVLIGDHIGAYRVTGGGGERGYTAAHRHTGQRVQVFVARAEAGGALELFQRARMYEAQRASLHATRAADRMQEGRTTSPTV